MFIYKITNLKNNKIYVGQKYKTSDWARYTGSGPLIQLAIKKYGLSNFKKEIIEYCVSKEDLDIKEQYWIKTLSTITPQGYNICLGGNQTTRGFKHSEKSRNKMSLAKKESYKGQGNPFYGKRHTEESKAMISKHHADFSGEKSNNFGTKRSNQTKQLISKNHADFSKELHPNYKHGKYCTTNYCIDCKKIISSIAKRCKKCNNLKL